MDYRIFKPVHRCECMWLHTGGCTDTVRWSALEVDSGKKIPCRSGESSLHQRRDSLMLYQLSYIPPTHPPPTMYLSIQSLFHPFSCYNSCSVWRLKHIQTIQMKRILFLSFSPLNLIVCEDCWFILKHIFKAARSIIMWIRYVPTVDTQHILLWYDYGVYVLWCMIQIHAVDIIISWILHVCTMTGWIIGVQIQDSI